MINSFNAHLGEEFMGLSTTAQFYLGRVLWVAIVLVLAVASAGYTSSSAWAAEPASVRVTGPGGFAAADWDWSAANHMDNVDIYVEDTSCNGQGTYAYFRVDADTNFSTTFRSDLNDGCSADGTSHNNLDVGPLAGETIYSAQFVIC
jgi:hypothetical protein